MSEPETTADERFEERQYDWYYNERRYLEEGRRGAEQRVDGMVAAGAGGALLLSITFLRQLVRSPDPTLIPLLLWSWLVLLAALVCSLASLLTSAKAYSTYVAALDQARKAKDLSLYTKCSPTANTWTRWLNRAAVILLIVGIVLFGVFGVRAFLQQPGLS